MYYLWAFLWVYLAPQKLEAYRNRHGVASLLRVGCWFGSTLIWLPSAVSIVGLYLQLTPRATVAEGAVLFALTMVAAAWLLGGLVGWIDARWATLLLGAFSGVGALGAIAALVAAWALGLRMGALSTLTLVVANGIAVATATALLFGTGQPALLFVAPLVLRLVVAVAGLQSVLALAPLVPDAWNYGWRGIVMGVLFLTVLIGGGALVMGGLQRVIGGLTLQLVGGSTTWAGRAALTALLLCVGLLVWVFLLGGWRLL